MHLTNLEEYGLRCFIQVAKAFDKEFSLSASLIAEREGLSVDYVVKIMNLFKKEGLINSKRGQFGGFSVTKSPDEIMLSEVLNSLKSPREKLYEDNFCGAFKGNKDKCVHECECSIRPLWHNIFELIDEFFSQVKISVFLNQEVQTNKIIKKILRSKIYETL